MKQFSRYSVSLYWNKRDMNVETKQAAISLTVNLPKMQFRVNLKVKSTKKDFDAAIQLNRSNSNDVRQLKRLLDDYVMKAESILDRLQSPTKDMFVRLFKAESNLFMSNKTDVFFLYHMKMDEAEIEGRIGTRNWYKTCVRCLFNYAPKLCFEEIDERWLKNYVMHLKGKGNSEATIGLKLRGLRLIVNVARKQGFMPKQFHPFEDFRISQTTKSKAVLYPEQLKALFEYQPVGVRETRAKAYFFFCYLANGMNFKDMVLLKYKDFKNDSFTFIREKTKTTVKSGVKEIRVYLHDEIKRIIAEFGNPSKHPDEYVFPILTKGTDAMRQYQDRIRHNKIVNRKLAQIGKKLGFDVHLCLNLARHSFATTLKISGQPLAHVSEAMGHHSITTTSIYMKSLPLENMKELSNQLLSFA